MLARYYFLVLICFTFSNLSEAQRPNVIWIIADDLSPDLGCYGESEVSTPNIDSLAQVGVKYTLAFATSPTCSPSRTAFVTGMYQTTIGGHHHRTRTMPKLNAVPPVMELMHQEGYFTCNMKLPKGRAKTDYNFEYDGNLFDGDDWSQRADGQPFFAQIQIKEPHRPFVQNKDPERPARVSIPPIYPDHPVTRADWANYLASVEVLDEKVGQVLQRLEDEGIADNTMVIFFGDHGRPHVWAKQWLYDGGIQVPLLIRWPGHVPAGRVDDQLASLIDVVPTTLAAAGVAIPEAIQGRNLFDESLKPRIAIFAARDRCGDAFDRIRCVRTKQFKYIRNFEPQRPYTTISSYKKLSYPVLTLMEVLSEKGELTPVQSRFLEDSRPAEELYDLRSDPHETINLANDAKYSGELKALRQQLEQWIEETKDQGANSEGDAEYEAAILAEKRTWYEQTMKRRKLDPDLTDQEYLDWWEQELGLD